MSERAKLPNWTQTPPGMWTYRVPETNKTFQEYSIDDLLQKVRNHLVANGYNVPGDLALQIEQQICQSIPSYCVDAQGKQAIENPLFHTFHVVKQFTGTMASWIYRGMELADQDLANARAGVCAGCYQNQPPEGCTGCNMDTLRHLVERMTGNRTTKYDSQLKACKACSCQLKSKVWFPHDVLWRNLKDEQKSQLPDFCWLLQENQSPDVDA